MMSLNIVIIGAGEVGYNLAKSLIKNEYEITIIDIDPVKCIRVKEFIVGGINGFMSCIQL